MLCLSLLLVDLHRCALTQQRKLCVWALCHSKIMTQQSCVVIGVIFMYYFGIFLKKLDIVWNPISYRSVVTGVILEYSKKNHSCYRSVVIGVIFFLWTFFFFSIMRSDFYSLYIPQVYMQLTISICLIEYFHSLEMCRVIYIGQNKGVPNSFYIIAQSFQHKVKGELTNPNEVPFMLLTFHITLCTNIYQS